MFIPRRFVAALLIGAALCTLPRLSLAVDADASPTPKATLKAHAAKKASPSPSPTAKKSQKSPTPAAKKSASPKPSPSASPKKTTSDTPKKSESSDNQPTKKKSKAKPKPATQKRQHSKQNNTESKKNAEPAPKRRAESEAKPEQEKKPEPKSESKTEEKKTEAPQKPSQRPAASSASQSTAPSAQESRGITSSRSTTPPVLPDNVIITKSGVQEEEPAEEPEQQPAPKTHWWWPFGGTTQHYKYLSRSVREAIDDAHVARHRWRYIVVHNSGTRQGSAKAFDYYHKHVRKMPNGLAYHFVIGNGTSTPNGYVEIGPRWINQINGGHVHSDYLNSIALGVCLVGDYNKDRPTKEQLEALDELVKYLRKRVGKTDHHLAIVKPHRDINPPQWPTDCPGDRFPYQWLSDKFDDQ